jgi:phosphopantothenoylcysteine synthetase/decarboxylase
MSARRVLVGVCGSGNLVLLPQHLLAIRARCEVEIRAVMTRTAATILPARTLRQICDEVYCDGADELDVSHVQLAAWAHRVVVIPATANMLGQVAHGLASGLLTSVLLAAEVPVLFFPAMNRRMWTKPTVRRNVAQLRADGHILVEPVMDDAWEIATQSMQPNPGLPSPTKVSAMVAEFLAPVDPPPVLGTVPDRQPIEPGEGRHGHPDPAG